jgi:O-antigen/teichoic acid export membrane protein
MVRILMHLGMGQAATTVLSILLSYALAKLLSTPDFGLLYLISTISTFAYVIIDWGHGGYIVREAARRPERAGDLMGTASALRAAGALLACPIVVATAWALGYDVFTRVLAGAMVLALLPQYLGLSFGWAFRASERMGHDALLNVLFKLALLIGSVSCLALGGHLPGLVFTSLVAGCLIWVVGLLMYKRLHLPRLSVTVSTARELLRDGAPMFAMTLAIAIEPFINANILYKLSSPTVVGWYGAAWTIGGTLVAPATVLGMAMYPRLSAVAGDAAEFRRTFDASFRPLFLVAVLGAVGTWLFAEVPVAIVYSLEKYGPTADILRAFAPLLLLMYVAILLSMAVVAAGKAGRLAGMKVVAVLLTTALVFVLVPLCQERLGNGGIGVMVAMLGGELMMVVASWFLLREFIDGRVIGDVARGLVAGAVTAALFMLLPSFTPFLAIPLCVLAFAALSLLLGAARRSDVELLLAYFRKRSADQRGKL